MAKPKTDETKPAFDVSKTDKRSDKRVVLDYVVAAKYADDLLPLFDRFGADIDAIIEEVDATEGGAIHTSVDTAIESAVEGVRRRFSEPDGEYADYVLRGNGASFFIPKTKRAVKTVEEKAKDLLSSASDEQLAALAAQMRERGIEF